MAASDYGNESPSVTAEGDKDSGNDDRVESAAQSEPEQGAADAGFGE